MEYGLDKTTQNFQNYANGQSYGTNIISQGTANAYIQRGTDNAHAKNAAYNCVSGEKTQKAIGAMTADINAAKDSANKKIQDNINREAERLAALALLGASAGALGVAGLYGVGGEADTGNVLQSDPNFIGPTLPIEEYIDISALDIDYFARMYWNGIASKTLNIINFIDRLADEIDKVGIVFVASKVDAGVFDKVSNYSGYALAAANAIFDAIRIINDDTLNVDQKTAKVIIVGGKFVARVAFAVVVSQSGMPAIVTLGFIAAVVAIAYLPTFLKLRRDRKALNDFWRDMKKDSDRYGERVR